MSIILARVPVRSLVRLLRRLLGDDPVVWVIVLFAGTVIAVIVYYFMHRTRQATKSGDGPPPAKPQAPTSGQDGGGTGAP